MLKTGLKSRLFKLQTFNILKNNHGSGCVNELRESGKPGRVCDGVVDCPDFSGTSFLCRQPRYIYSKPGSYREMSSIFGLTNSVLVYEPKCGVRGRSRWVSANEYSCIRAQINFGDLTPYLTYNI
jgi:hypothetical protein